MGQGAVAEVDLSQLGDIHANVIPRSPKEAARVAAVTAPASDFLAAEPYEANTAGKATVARDATKEVFLHPSKGFPKDKELDFKLGFGLFKKLWVSSPSSTKASDGLGPIYNARSCLRCHDNNGRGHPPEAHEMGAEGLKTSMFLRVSRLAPEDAPLTEIEAYLAKLDGPNATPRTRAAGPYGFQLQDRALHGMEIEAKWSVSYEEIEVPLAGGEIAHLRKPTYRIEQPGSGTLPDDILLSPRVGNPMIGLGLLEAIPTTDILALADPDDADGDGISGRPNIVWSRKHAAPMLGRFGWKAINPTIEQQSAAAFSGDIGISNPMFPSGAGECTEAQVSCINGYHGDQDVRGFEIDQTGMDLVTLYTRHGGVPARADVDDPQVLRGKRLFQSAQCAACHTPKFVTQRLDTTEAPEDAPLSFQLIWPYTDLLLHDMGKGLADHRPDGRATGVEWRTAPLWGIGLTAQVSGHTYLLHDGRARSLLEAILWHGGEAQKARDTVVQMSPDQRADLIRFLESL